MKSHFYVWHSASLGCFRLWSGLEPTSKSGSMKASWPGFPETQGQCCWLWTVCPACSHTQRSGPGRPRMFLGSSCIQWGLIWAQPLGLWKYLLRKINILHNVFTRIICFVLYPSYCKMENYCLTAKKFILGCSCQFSTKYGAENPKLLFIHI